MEFKQITTKEEWEAKNSGSKQAQFLQSWEWGEFQIRLGRQIWRLELEGNFFLVIKMPLPLKQNYLYVPRIKTQVNDSILKSLTGLAQQEKSLWLRLEPVEQNLQNLGFIKVRAIQPQQTLLLDLSKDIDTLLAEMHSKTRYNIRLAEKKGVTVRVGVRGQAEQFAHFFDLLLDTYRRKDKGLHSREYYQQLYHDHLAKLYFADYQNKVLCANMVIFYGDTVTYLHGGSSQEDKNIMAPHLLQWEQIKKAKALGYRYYDFWGIDESKWPGVTRFKLGFGGFPVTYSGTWDLAVNKLAYGVYKFFKKWKH